MKYVIQSRVDRDNDGSPLFWSVSHGWVTLPDADLFTEDEQQRLTLPAGSSWEPAL